MFRLVTQYVMLHFIVLLIWLFETRFLVTLLGWVWICVFLIMGKFSKKSHHVLSGHAIGLICHFAM